MGAHECDVVAARLFGIEQFIAIVVLASVPAAVVGGIGGLFGAAHPVAIASVTWGLCAAFVIQALCSSDGLPGFCSECGKKVSA